MAETNQDKPVALSPRKERTCHYNITETANVLSWYADSRIKCPENTAANGLTAETGADDDGHLTYAIATDEKHRTIVIRFPHPTEWIGLDIESAEELRDQLTERLLFLRGIRDAAENVDATLEKLKAAEARQRDVFRRQESDE